jgi:hypothetical protein
VSAAIECPHCHALVLTLPGEICPACTRAVREESATGALRRVTLREIDDVFLPSICIQCGQLTHDVDRFSASRPGTQSPWLRAFLIVALPLLSGLLTVLLPIGFILGYKPRRGPSERPFELQIPRCAFCASRGHLREEFLNFQRGEASFLAHRAFADALKKKLNPRGAQKRD